MEEGRGKGLWIGLIGFAVVAIVFLVLWFMRGGDVDRLTSDLGSSQASVRRLEGDLRDVRTQVDASNRRVAELENQVRDETRRLTEAADQLERRLKSDLDFSEQRLAAANAEMDRLRTETEIKATAETTRLRDELDKARKDLADTRSAGARELERFNRELADANATIKDLGTRLEAGDASIRNLEQALKSTRDVDDATPSEIAEIKDELARTALALSEARNANAVLEDMRGRLAASIESDKAAAITREQELMRTIEELSALIEEEDAEDSFTVSAAIPDSRDRDIVALRQEVTGYQRKITELEVAGEHAAGAAASAAATAAEWKNRAESLERDLEEWKVRASAETAAIGERLQARLDSVGREFEAFKERSLELARTADDNWRDRLAQAEKSLEDLRVESAAKAERLESEFASRTEAAAKELADFKRRAAEEFAAVEKRAAENLADLEKRSADEVAAVEKRAVDELAALEKRAADQIAAIEKQTGDELAAAEKRFADRIAAVEEQAADALAAAEKRAADGIAAVEKRAADRIAEVEKRAADEIAVVEKRAADQVADVRKRAADEFAAAEQRAAAEFAAAERRAADELAAVEKRASDEIAALKRDHEGNVRGLYNDFNTRLDAVRKEGAAQLAASEKRSADTIGEMRKVLAERDARIGELEESERESARRIVLLKNAFTRQAEIMQENSARFEKEKTELGETIDDLRTTVTELSPGGVRFAPFPIGRSVGRIVDRLSDGQTLLIEGGVNQRVKPGMKFDVFRPIGDANRYAGMIKVIRVLDDFSMAVSSYAEITGLVCPVTGRAVLEPDAKYSPYALTRDGKPVELVPGDEFGMPLEAPAIGDHIDNPFYLPDRQARFVVAPELRGDPCIVAAIEALSGTPRSGEILEKDADFVVVENADVEPDAPASGPRRVSIGHLARYLDPAPAR